MTTGCARVVGEFFFSVYVCLCVYGVYGVCVCVSVLYGVCMCGVWCELLKRS